MRQILVAFASSSTSSYIPKVLQEAYMLETHDNSGKQLPFNKIRNTSIKWQKQPQLILGKHYLEPIPPQVTAEPPLDLTQESNCLILLNNLAAFGGPGIRSSEGVDYRLLQSDPNITTAAKSIAAFVRAMKTFIANLKTASPFALLIDQNHEEPQMEILKKLIHGANKFMAARDSLLVDDRHPLTWNTIEHAVETREMPELTPFVS